MITTGHIPGKAIGFLCVRCKRKVDLDELESDCFKCPICGFLYSRSKYRVLPEAPSKMKIFLTLFAVIYEGNCRFRPCIDKDGNLFMEIGCRPMHGSDAASHFMSLCYVSVSEYRKFQILPEYHHKYYDGTERFFWKINTHQLKADVMAMDQCVHCGGLKIEPRRVALTPPK